MKVMNVVWIGLVLVAAGALLGLLKQKWTAPAILGVVIGFGLAGYGFFSSQSQPPALEETVLASDAGKTIAETTKQPAPATTEPATSKPKAEPQAVADAAENQENQPAKQKAAEEVATAPNIPEHVIPGKVQPWVEELAKLVAKPNHFPLTQSSMAPEDAPNKGDRIYEYVDIKLGGRAFQTVFLSKSPTDPNMWMVHVEPGAKSPPIQAEELGDVRVLGEGGNFIVFRLESGPFTGNYLIWASGGHRGGGEAIRVYSPAFLSREHGLAAQIAADAAKAPAAR